MMKKKKSPSAFGSSTSAQRPETTTWVDRLPVSVRSYVYLARIDKPTGILLLYYPCAWSITMASYAHQLPYTTLLKYLSLFGIGAVLGCNAGCIINDMWDKNLDKAVERTKDRPLARGDLNLRQAIGFLSIQLIIGIGILLSLNWYSILLGALSVPVITVYPLMKRITYCPSAVLGLACNWGALLGWSALAGAVDWAICLPLYAGGICWSVVYDSIYAHQDKNDDVRAGIRSAALLFGAQTRPILLGFSLSSISLISYAGYLNMHGAPFYCGISLASVQFARVLYKTDFESPPSCWKGFVGCGWAGFWVWMGALADYTLLLRGVKGPVSYMPCVFGQYIFRVQCYVALIRLFRKLASLAKDRDQGS